MRNTQRDAAYITHDGLAMLDTEEGVVGLERRGDWDRAP